MSQAIAEAALITFVPLVLLKGGPDDFGSEVSFFVFGGTTFTLVVLLANSKVCVCRHLAAFLVLTVFLFVLLLLVGLHTTLRVAGGDATCARAARACAVP